MVRIDHAACYFMPLFCSSKPYVRVNCVLASMVLFLTLLAGYGFVGEPIREANLFNPNAQDYFRASLLGIFSPMLYYFVQTFLISLNRRYLVLNLLVDFLFNDWFILLIIVCLAYPQQEQTKSSGEGSGAVWHIVPRQTYVFGVTWSLGEFIVCVFGNLFNYRELPHKGTDKTNGPLSEHDDCCNRDGITLSKCLDVRRDSSFISNNVYYSEADAKTPRSYGSTAWTQRSTNPDYTPDGEPVLLVGPGSNSLRLASIDYDKDARVLEAQRQWGSLLGIAESQHANGVPVKQFVAITSKRALLGALCVMLLVQLSNALLIVGQCLIASIYFTYVRGHEHLFTPAVNYFGQRTITYFLLTVMVPFTTLNLVMNAAIYMWKDLESWFNYRCSSPTEPTDYDYYDTEISLQRSRPTSLPQDLALSDPALISSANAFNYGYYDASQDSLQPDVPRLLTVARRIIGFWKRIARKDSFVLTSMLLWGATVFAAGFVATVPL